ncbi:MAG: hypothetical protein ABMB14_40405, partial [Myxococcota bacterium]
MRRRRRAGASLDDAAEPADRADDGAGSVARAGGDELGSDFDLGPVGEFTITLSEDLVRAALAPPTDRELDDATEPAESRRSERPPLARQREPKPRESQPRDAQGREAQAREALAREALAREALAREALAREALAREARDVQ